MIYAAEPESLFVITAYELTGKPLAAYRKRRRKKIAMTENKFPAGWDESRIKKVIAYYERQTEGGAVAEDEAEMEPSEAVMKVPHDLVPIVRELIAKRQR